MTATFTFARTLLLSLSLAALLSLPAAAANRFWDGGAAPNLDWSEGGATGNWTGLAIPTSADVAIFNHIASET